MVMMLSLLRGGFPRPARLNVPLVLPVAAFPEATAGAGV
jgi:hypothetical protein